MSLVTLPADVTGGRNVQVDARYSTIVTWIARTFGVTASSGYRSSEHNQEIGGASNSDHLSGYAVDFVGGNLTRLQTWAEGQGFPYVEPAAESKDHVHISFARRAGNAAVQPASTTTSTSTTGAAAQAAGGCAPTLLLIFLVGLDIGMRYL